MATPIASSSLGAPKTVSGGTIEFGSGGNQRSSTLYYTGLGETTDRVMQVGFNSGSDQTIYANGSGLLKFTSTFVIDRSSGGQGASLILRGTGNGEMGGGTSGGVIPGVLQKTDAGLMDPLAAQRPSMTSLSVAARSTLMARSTQSPVRRHQAPVSSPSPVEH